LSGKNDNGSKKYSLYIGISKDQNRIEIGFIQVLADSIACIAN